MSTANEVKNEPGPTIVYTIPGRTDSEETRFTIDTFHGALMFSIRRWYKEKTSGQFRPTRFGATFSSQLLPEIQKGIEAVAATLSAEIPGEDPE
jgi:hypothetical protein